MTVIASINLNQSGNKLVYAGRGRQPNCDFPKGVVIGEEVTPASDTYLQVQTDDGKTLYVKHGDYQELDAEIPSKQ